MHTCPFCDGKGYSAERQYHFGDGDCEAEICLICKGTGKIEVQQVQETKIRIIKFHGVWQG